MGIHFPPEVLIYNCLSYPTINGSSHSASTLVYMATDDLLGMGRPKYLKLTNLFILYMPLLKLTKVLDYYFINMQHVVEAHLRQFVMSAG